MKAALRTTARRQPIPSGASAKIQARLLTEDWWALAFQVGLYRATPTEPATDLLFNDLWARGAQTAVPKSRQTTYGWCWVDAQTTWQAGPYGLAEPSAKRWAQAQELRVIVTPGLAFDASGGRLGRGGGHYDRLLRPTEALRVGLIFENRLLASIPQEPHDVKVDVVVTEKRVWYTATAEPKLARLLTGRKRVN